jgi:hypothetical protein
MFTTYFFPLIFNRSRLFIASVSLALLPFCSPYLFCSFLNLLVLPIMTFFPFFPTTILSSLHFSSLYYYVCTFSSLGFLPSLHLPSIALFFLFRSFSRLHFPFISPPPSFVSQSLFFPSLFLCSTVVPSRFDTLHSPILPFFSFAFD